MVGLIEPYQHSDYCYLYKIVFTWVIVVSTWVASVVGDWRYCVLILLLVVTMSLYCGFRPDCFGLGFGLTQGHGQLLSTIATS